MALHFATAKRERDDTDGAAWMVDHGAAHEHAPRPLRKCLEEEGADVFTTEMLGRVATGCASSTSWAEDFVVSVEPPSFDERIVNQYALFSLMSQANASNGWPSGPSWCGGS